MVFRQIYFFLSIFTAIAYLSCQAIPVSIALKNDARLDLNANEIDQLSAVSKTIKDILDDARSDTDTLPVIPINTELPTFSFLMNHLNEIGDSQKMSIHIQRYIGKFKKEYQPQVLISIWELARYLDLPIVEKTAFNYLRLYQKPRNSAHTENIEIVLADEKSAFISKKDMVFIKNLFESSSTLRELANFLGHSKVEPQLFEYSSQGASLNPLYLQGISVESFYQLVSVKNFVGSSLSYADELALRKILENKNIAALMKLAQAADFLDLKALFTKVINQIIGKMSSPETVALIKKQKKIPNEFSIFESLDPLAFFAFKNRLFPDKMIHKQLEIKPYIEVLAMTFNIFDELIIAQCEEKTIIIQNTTTGSESRYDFQAKSHVAAFNTNTQKLALGLADGSVYMVDRTTATVSKNMNPHAQPAFSTNRVRSITFSQDDRYLVAGLNDKKALIWKLPELTLQATLHGDKYDAFNSIVLSPDSNYIASKGATLKRISFWQLATGKFIGNFVKQGMTPTSFVFWSDNKTVIIATKEKQLIFYDFIEAKINELLDLESEPQMILLSRPKKMMGIVGKDKIHLINLAAENESITIKSGAAKKACFSSDGSLIAFLDKKNALSFAHTNAISYDSLSQKAASLLKAVYKTEHLIIIYAFIQELKNNDSIKSPILNELILELQESSKENTAPEKKDGHI